jgi:hypothetical protein
MDGAASNAACQARENVSQTAIVWTYPATTNSLKSWLLVESSKKALNTAGTFAARLPPECELYALVGHAITIVAGLIA